MLEYDVASVVSVTFDFIGFHHWPEAPAEVHYLASRHRHLFRVQATVSVEHNDREVEYHTLKRQMMAEVWRLGEIIDGTVELDLGPQSCEGVAADLLNSLRFLYPGRQHYSVVVSEDGENHASVSATLRSEEAQGSPAVNSEEAAGNTVTSETGSSQVSPEPLAHSVESAPDWMRKR